MACRTLDVVGFKMGDFFGIYRKRLPNHQIYLSYRSCLDFQPKKISKRERNLSYYTPTFIIDGNLEQSYDRAIDTAPFQYWENEGSRAKLLLINCAYQLCRSFSISCRRVTNGVGCRLNRSLSKSNFEVRRAAILATVWNIFLQEPLQDQQMNDSACLKNTGKPLNK